MSEPKRQIVAKVGGSLLDWRPLPSLLAQFLATLSPARVVLIAGGSGAADWVRRFDRAHSLGDEAAHHLAVRSLDLTAHALAAILPGSEVAETLASLGPCWQSGRVPILSPRLVLAEDDRTAILPLPRSWEATTDSIAARIARVIRADELILLKSATAPPDATAAEMAQLGLVDPLFPTESRGISIVRAINLRDDETGAQPPKLSG